MQTIAIVGMACRYPDTRSPQELWENALAQRRAFRTIPQQRLNLNDYYHSNRNMPDRTYSSQGAFLTDYAFDREHFRISGKTYRSTDLTHWLALQTAEQALADAGFAKDHGLPNLSTGVIVGNTLTGEFSRAQMMRLRWPYVARVVTQELLQENWQPEAIKKFLTRLEQEYKKPFAPVNEESLAGGLSNTIAGRICNYFDLKGGGYTVDGACSSSLLALTHACRALESFDVDLALAGGVDLSIDPFEIIGFAKTSALAAEEMRVYDLHSRGFLPGEGCGFVVLMRYEDALAENRHIYACIRGWGISSDGSGGITRPEAEGQHIALMRAYRRSGLSADTVPYIEGHGTGTEVGDATELKAITLTWDKMQHFAPEKQTYISTIKANIGHTKAAAGIAGVIKATMALSNQIIPPTTGMIEPHAEMMRPDARVKGLRQGRLWPAEAPLVAGVSSMGFGGINTHIVLEGMPGERRDHLSDLEQKLLTTHQDAEIFLLSALNAEDLQEQIVRLLSMAPRLSYAELTDLAAYLAGNLQPGSMRAAVIASRPHELERNLQQLQEILAAGASTHIDTKLHIYLGSGTTVPRIAFLFPGQGSPAYLSGGILRTNFSEIEQLYREMNLPEDADGKQTEIAQPAITLASLAGLHMMERLGVHAQTAIGHSLGELSALHWAGVMDSATLLRVARARGEAMAQVKDQDGAMLSIKASAEVVTDLIGDEPVVISGFNSPRQTVIAGGMLAVYKISARAHAMGIPCVPLAVSHAFHSPLVAPSADILASHLAQEHFTSPRRPIVSTVTGKVVKDDDITELLFKQVTAPVLFFKAVERIHEDIDLFIEVGPGHSLQRLLSDITPRPAVATDAGSSSMRGILSATAAAFVLGAPVNAAALFSHRFTRPIDLDWNPSFLVNPCEQAPQSEIERNEEVSDSLDSLLALSYAAGQTTFELVQKIIAARTEMPLDLLVPECRMLSDLHLNSISVGEIFAEACRALEITHAGPLLKYADASLSEIAQTLEDLQQQGNSSAISEQAREPEGLAPWIRCFSTIEQEYPLAGDFSSPEAGDWQMFAPPDYSLTNDLQRTFAMVKGTGCIVCLPQDRDSCYVRLLFQAARAVLAKKEMTHVVVVQHGAVGAAFARSLYLEYPQLTVCVVHLPDQQAALVEHIAIEVRAAQGFVEVSYDAAGKRTLSEFVPYEPVRRGEAVALQQSDVVLVTGGGKGIAAECALALAQDTGVTLALLGRARPQQDTVLRDSLSRFDVAGVSYRYFSVDVQNATAIAEVVREIESSLGTVTAIIHGAGMNQPTLLSMLDEELINRTIAPKVQGLQNVLAAISPTKIKSLITFGSVIARTGMQGEAHYALANEWLAHITAAFQQQHPTASCLCIEWSVWSDVGMGERLGRVEALRAEGITPIPVEQGLALFRQLQTHRQSSTRIVVSGRVGSAPTIRFASTPLPFLRFLEKARVFYPGIELIAEAELSRTTDIYVDEHQLQGERLVPAVMGLEAMAQVARAVTGKYERPCFNDVQFLRPLIVAERGSVTLRMLALAHPDGMVEVAIRCSETGYQVNHFQAVCFFEEQPETLTTMLSGPVAQEPAARLPQPGELYGGIFFHRGRFRRLKEYTLLHARECVAEISPYTEGAWFARYLPQELVLGDPASRDAYIHVIQSCIPQATLLPVHVESISVINQPFSSVLAPGEHIQVHARERARQGNTFIYDLEACNSHGQILEQWRGLYLHMVGETVSHEQWTEALFGPYAERRIAELAPWMQPLLLSVHGATDDGSLSVQPTGLDQKLCNLQIARPRSDELWRSLLCAQEYAFAQQLAAQNGEAFDIAASRVLAVSEVLKSAALPRDLPWMQMQVEQDGWQLLTIGSHHMLTAVISVRTQPHPYAFAFYCPPTTDIEKTASVPGVEKGLRR
ncbi:type I polyketide synthase [Dictyobacter aurantiacus]|nr:type I polyketide synthase [Dictyobacter aurantiacus]